MLFKHHRLDQALLFAIIKSHNAVLYLIFLWQDDVWLCFRGQATKLHILTQQGFRKIIKRFQKLKSYTVLKCVYSFNLIKRVGN